MSRVRKSVASLGSRNNTLCRACVEPVESRRLLAVAVNSGVLTITGTGGADTYVVAAGGANITVVENGGAPQSFTAAGVNSILANLGGGNDSLSIADAVTKNSVLNGEGGNDTLTGGGGADTLDGGFGNDSLNGGAGSDTVDYSSRSAPITGSLAVDYTRRNDLLLPLVDITGQGGASGETDTYKDVETINGGAGDDTLSTSAESFYSSGDSDPEPLPPPIRINGNDGNDNLYAGGSGGLIGEPSGFPSIVADGGAGNDVFSGGAISRNSTTLIGGSGDDVFDLPSDDDSATIDAGSGFDSFTFRGLIQRDYTMPPGLEKLSVESAQTIIGNDEDNIIEGSASSIDGAGGNDTITLSTYFSSGMISGGEGNDTLKVGSGDYTIAGGAGDDVIRVNEGGNIGVVGSGAAEVNGGTGDDQIIVIGGTDTVRGGDGNDTIYAGVGDDRVYGDAGDDRLNGDGGKDSIYGGSGDDRLYGASGSDRLFGESGVDRLYGGNKNDYLDGGAGGDYVKGNEDTDTAKKDKKDRRYEGVEIFV